MQIKIDTKEKFNILTPLADNFTDNIAYELNEKVQDILLSGNKNIIIDLKNILTTGSEKLNLLAEMHSKVYAENASMVICNIQPAIKKQLTHADLWDSLNITPTESEAWDMVQMEEMEREMFAEDEE